MDDGRWTMDPSRRSSIRAIEGYVTFVSEYHIREICLGYLCVQFNLLILCTFLVNRGCFRVDITFFSIVFRTLQRSFWIFVKLPIYNTSFRLSFADICHKLDLSGVFLFNFLLWTNALIVRCSLPVCLEIGHLT